VSWTGGTKETRKDLRTLSLDTLKPVIDAIDGTFISCQYASSDEEIRKFEDATGKKIHSLPEVFESARWMRYHVIDDNGDTLAIARKKDVAKDFVNAYGGTIENHNGPAFDYDDTAAFVTAIDELGGYIIAVNGTLVHLCGALGVPCGTLTPSKPAWRYGLKRKNMIWYGDHVRQYRQKGVDWQIAINDLIGELLRKRHAA